MKIGIDIMGGDFAPKAVLEGCYLAEKDIPEEYKFVLIGNLEVLQKDFLQDYNYFSSNNRFELIHAPETIEMAEHPVKAIQSKQNSSLVAGFKMLATGKIDVFMSAGNTGAMLVGALYSVKAIEGVIRPAITSFIPKLSGKTGIILDVGINPDCRQDVLMQFGLLGSAYLEKIYDIKNPRVGLLNIGSEPEKGNLVSQAAYTMLDAQDKINFIGNVEGYDLLNDKADVIVCDGFTGNILLKNFEGFYHTLKTRGLMDEYFSKFNYELYGGTPILGVNKPVVVGHGISNEIAFMNMIKQGVKVVETNLIEKITSLIKSQINI